ncbi:MAG: hypothetical protein JWP51_4980 [Bradyrhizobium sp.]|jgi:hypothetical protein|nr:hypothetical protein [Bradyrhizobium sp.]
MSVSSPSAATASQPQSPDIQQLVGLLGSLMPLLLRFQSQGFAQPLEQPFQGIPGQAVPGNVVMPNPALDHQAAQNLIGDMIAESLRTLSAYLEANAGQYGSLESCVPIVTQAAHRFAARDYAQAFNLIWLAYRVIETVRAADPRIPPPRTAFSDQTSSSIH